MNNVPIAPNPGEKISATLIREIIRSIRERTPIQGPGVKLSSGPNGTVISSESTKSRAAEVKGDVSCFRLEGKELEVDGEDETHTFLVDCYYNVGGITKHVNDIDIEDLIPEGDGEEDDEDDEEEEEVDDEEEEDVIIYFKIEGNGELTVDSCAPSELLELQRDPTCYVYPLYAYSGDGELKTDLRTAPQIQKWEVL